MREQAYDKSEEELLRRIRPVIRGSGDGEVSSTFAVMEENIRRLSDAFYGYPSILDPRGSGEDLQSVRTLVETLFHGGIDHTVLLPTKVVVGRSFMIAKFNLFGFLRKLCRRWHSCDDFRDELQRHWERIIFSLLLEDVYQVIIERADYDEGIRRRAAIDLINLWEHRFDGKVTEYAPTLVDLWSVRRRITPVFGTMMGTMELMRLSSVLPDRWHHFMARHAEDDEVVYALEEFLFGLSYEDLLTVREDMRRRHVSVIDRGELSRIPGIDMIGDEVTSVDPREMYRFYQDRTTRAGRRRISGNAGPTRTLEELLLIDMLHEQMETAPASN